MWGFECKPNNVHTYIQICRCIRGEGPPALRESDRVPDETQAARYEREKEHRRQIDHIQDDHQPHLLVSPVASSADTAPTPTRVRQPSNTLLLLGGDSDWGSFKGMEDTGCSTQKIDDKNGKNTRAGIEMLPPPRKLVTLGSYSGGPFAVGDEDALSLPPASLGRGCSVRQPVAHDRDRARAVAAVPYPTIRSLRKS